MLRNHLRIAGRLLARNKVYATINVLGLSIGICGCIVIWLVASYEWSFDRFHPGKDRIFRVVGSPKTPDFQWATTIPPMPAAMRTQITGLDGVATCFDYNESSRVSVPEAGKPARISQAHMVAQPDFVTGFAIVDQNWFRVFHYQWLAGNPQSALAHPFTVVLTKQAMERYFGDQAPADVIGRELIYGDSLHVRVAGVVEDWKEHSELAFTDFISFPTIAASFLKQHRRMDDWVLHSGPDWVWPYCFVKLDKGVDPGQIEVQMNRILSRQAVTNPKHPLQEALQPVADIHFNNSYRENNRHRASLPTLYALGAIALFILILASVNFINLSTAQSLQRAREIGVRKVLGSSRLTLVLQFLIETSLLTLLAVLIASLLVWPVMHFFQDYIPEAVHFNPLAPGNLIFLSGATVLVTLFAGYYPARVLSGYQPVQTLKGASSIKGGEKWWLRRSLIVFQFSISLTFIIVTLVTGKQIRFMLNTDYGFKSDAILTVSGEWRDTTGKIGLLEQRFQRIPGIAQMTRENNSPAGWARQFRGMTYKGETLVDFTPTAEFADERYIPFYGMRLIAGRNIRRSDSLSEFVINETGARQLGFIQPSAVVGQTLYYDEKPYSIVGVVADFHEGSFRESIGPAVIGHSPGEETTLAVKLAVTGKGAENIKATLDAMAKEYKEVFPKQTFSVRFMDDTIRAMYLEEQKTVMLVRVAMGLAIFISCMGLFGLSLFTTERRAGEIGIRKVLGATTADIALMLNRQFIRLVLLALAIAAPISWMLAHSWLQDFAYRVSIDGGIFLLAGSGAIALALITVSYQSIRAAMANPVKSLKTE